VTISRTQASWSPRAGLMLPPGTWVVRSSPSAVRDVVPTDGHRNPQSSTVNGQWSNVNSLVASLGLRAWELARAPTVVTTAVRPRRIGLYKSWVASTDEGWTRWLLEQYGFRYESVTNAAIKAGRLEDRFDVLIFPSQSPQQIVDGYQPDQRPSTPGPWNPPPPEYQGGIGTDGTAYLRAFVAAGGTLVTLDQASDLVIDRFGGVFDDVRDVTRNLSRTDFYCPGSVLRLTLDPAEPVAWGMEPDAAGFFEHSRAFETAAGSVRHIARYATADRLLMSGWLLGRDRIAGRDAALDVPFGRGHVVLFAFRPQFRAQPHGTFKLLFNALY
jgi:ribosomal protein S18 acetylase RimI-like enzyme